jgi:hypothetical protein
VLTPNLKIAEKLLIHTLLFRWLIVESRLVELDALIKGRLSLAKAEPDKCLDYLNEMLSLTIYPLMLKKHPRIVETIKKVNFKFFVALLAWKTESCSSA